MRLSSRKGDGSEKIYHAVLTPEGIAFFERLCAGRAGDAAMFGKGEAGLGQEQQADRCARRAGGRRSTAHRVSWVAAHMGVACRHERRSLLVVAKNLGHCDTRMVERHYGHLAPSYIADAIRAGAPRFGASPRDNVTSLDTARR